MDNIIMTSVPVMTRRLQMMELSCMLEVDRICKEEGLVYYLIEGSLLGAVRHGGFIPWDDDLDIGMPRKDFDRFMEIGQKRLGGKYFLQNYETDSESYVAFAKVRINGTRIEEISTRHLNCHQGIYIDIFPLDAVSRVRWIRAVKRFYRNQLLKIWLLKVRPKMKMNPALRVLREIIGKTVSVRWLGREIHSSLRKYQYANTGNMTSALSMYGEEKELLPEAGYGLPRIAEFEELQLNIPAHAETLLRQVYGDYMRPPPEEMRTGHAVAHLDFGDQGK